MIGMQVIERLEWFHTQTFVHRDMKPENILIGTGKRSDLLYLIDFGLSKRYICPRTGDHIGFKVKKGMTGTAEYLSVSAHGGGEHSPRDDMESLGYILVWFFHKGKLPWSIERPVCYEFEEDDPDGMEL
jgi:serine/threonine protein kinase